MDSSRLTTLLGIAATTSVLFVSGCVVDTAGSDAVRCGGRAYDNVMFNTDQYDVQDRGRVTAALRDSVGDPAAEILRRVTPVTGEGNARRITDEFSICLAG
ncbi:MAG TPA: hypothetical protein GX696_07670 [Pseudomonadaceae bacterium]|nr:hypothetical protein [Pseudomonadaceae bacterium]